LYDNEKAAFNQDFQGPRQSDQARAVAEPVMRQQLMPNDKPMLIAPPILVNYQSQHDVCEGLSAYVLERQSQLAETLCRGTYGCLTAGEPLIRPSQLRTCAGKSQGINGTNCRHYYKDNQPQQLFRQGRSVEGFRPMPLRHPCLAPPSHGLSVPTNVSPMTRYLAVHQHDFVENQQGFSGKYECTNVPKRVHRHEVFVH
jgi:hypothetical protein